MQTAVLDAINAPSLRAYVVWVPILPTDEGPPPEETRLLVADRRASHFWDAGRALPGPFGRILQLPTDWPAWDVYLAYPRGPRWEKEPPVPVFWQHQLGDQPNAPRLDGEAFAAQLSALLDDGQQARRS